MGVLKFSLENPIARDDAYKYIRSACSRFILHSLRFYSYFYLPLSYCTTRLHGSSQSYPQNWNPPIQYSTARGG